MLENLGMALIKIMLKRLIKVKEIRCFLVKMPTCSGDIACLNHSKIHHNKAGGPKVVEKVGALRVHR